MDIVKICGLSDSLSITTACRHSATHLGFIFHPESPRYITLDQAAELSLTIPNNCERVAVCVDADDTFLQDIISSLSPTFLQLHGSETPERISEIKLRFHLPIIKAVGILSKQDLDSLVLYDSVPSIDYLLLDYKSPKSFGGSGKQFDWSLLSGLRTTKPLILAGGINLSNLPQAFDLINDSTNSFIGLDVSSGVEGAIGVKDIGLIEQFLSQVSQATKGNR